MKILTKKITPLLTASFLLGLLAGCGIFGGDTEEGVIALQPDDTTPTEELLEGRPNGLIPDTENRRYTDEQLRGDTDNDTGN